MGTKFSREELSRLDGREGRPAYVAYRGTVYDVTGSQMGRDGAHFKLHLVGQDHTESLESAPHGEEVLADLPVVGRLEG